MFIVNCEGEKYLVQFYHPHRRRFQKNQRRTVCTIKLVTADNGKVVVNTGNAMCMPPDKFNKRKGEIVSLANALKDDFQKQCRKLFFDGYLAWEKERKIKPK